jgi:hypothetical protein
MSRSAFSDSVGNQVFQVMYQGPSQTISIGAASVQSAALDPECDIVRIACDQDCFVEIGSDPTASTSSMYFPKGSVEYFGTDGGWKVAVIQKDVAGTLYITEGA